MQMTVPHRGRRKIVCRGSSVVSVLGPRSRLGGEKTWPIFPRRGRQDLAIAVIPGKNREEHDGSPGFDGDLHPGGRDRVLLRRRTAASRRAAGGLEDCRPARNLSGGQAAHALNTRTDTNRGRSPVFPTSPTAAAG